MSRWEGSAVQGVLYRAVFVLGHDIARRFYDTVFLPKMARARERSEDPKEAMDR
jgi:hypothetical protein